MGNEMSAELIDKFLIKNEGYEESFYLGSVKVTITKKPDDYVQVEEKNGDVIAKRYYVNLRDDLKYFDKDIGNVETTTQQIIDPSRTDKIKKMCSLPCEKLEIINQFTKDENGTYINGLKIVTNDVFENKINAAKIDVENKFNQQITYFNQEISKINKKTSDIENKISNITETALKFENDVSKKTSDIENKISNITETVLKFENDVSKKITNLENKTSKITFIDGTLSIDGNLTSNGIIKANNISVSDLSNKLENVTKIVDSINNNVSKITRNENSTQIGKLIIPDTYAENGTDYIIASVPIPGTTPVMYINNKPQQELNEETRLAALEQKTSKITYVNDTLTINGNLTSTGTINGASIKSNNISATTITGNRANIDIINATHISSLDSVRASRYLFSNNPDNSSSITFMAGTGLGAGIYIKSPIGVRADRYLFSTNPDNSSSISFIPGAGIYIKSSTPKILYLQNGNGAITHSFANNGNSFAAKTFWDNQANEPLKLSGTTNS